MSRSSQLNPVEKFRQKLKAKREVGPPDIILAPMYGEVGAGTVVPFTPRHGESTPVVKPPNEKASDIGTVLVCGSSLEDMDIFSGDLLIFTKRFSKNEIFNDRVFLVHIIATGEFLAKKIVPHGLDTVILRASGGGVRDMHFQRDDIELKGLVLGFQRMWR